MDGGFAARANGVGALPEPAGVGADGGGVLAESACVGAVADEGLAFSLMSPALAR